MWGLQDGSAGSLSLDLQTRHQDPTALFLSGRRLPGRLQVPHFRASGAVGRRDDVERRIGKSMVGRRRWRLADRDHRPVDREPGKGGEVDHPAIDDRQAGGDAGGLYGLAVVAAEMRTLPKIKAEAAAADRQVAARGGEGSSNIGV